MRDLRSLNRHLKNYDSELYAQNSHGERIDVYRKSKFNLNPPHLVFSLTENWVHTSKPVDYGIEVILQRLQAMDLWRDDRFVDNYLKGQQKIKAASDRDRQNNVESFLYDFRGQFQKATNDINTSTLKKLHRKENSHGYCES